MGKFKVVFALVIAIALLVRFYNFEDRIKFSPEQAISLIYSGDYMVERPTLLGEPNVQRVTSLGHRIFHPPVFNYSLVPLLFIFNWNPVPITAYFTLLNIFTGLALFFVLRKITNKQVALFALIIFLFDYTMINHSLFIWNQNFIPLLNILAGFFLYQLYKKKEKETKNVFLIGLLAGLCIGIEFLYSITALLLFFLVTIWSRQKLKSILFFIFGLFVSLLPTVIFDVKHDFYFLRTLFQYLLDTLQGLTQGSINYYHFLQFWPLLAVFGGFVINALYQKSKWLGIGVILLYVSWNLLPQNINLNKPLGMSEGINIKKLDLAAEKIAEDKRADFNVAAMLDFDSRAYPLRYFLKFKYHANPLDVEQYKNASNLYVLARSDYNFEKAIAYEITVFRPFKVEILSKIDNDYSVFKLKHQ